MHDLHCATSYKHTNTRQNALIAGTLLGCQAKICRKHTHYTPHTNHTTHIIHNTTPQFTTQHHSTPLTSACLSFSGLKSRSCSTTVSAAVRLIPSPPALVDSRNTVGAESECASRKIETVREYMDNWDAVLNVENHRQTPLMQHTNTWTHITAHTPTWDGPVGVELVDILLSDLHRGGAVEPKVRQAYVLQQHL